MDGATLPILYMKLGFLPVFAFTVLTNAVLLTAVLPLWMLMKNMVRLGFSGLRGKWGLAALGYPLKIEQLNRPHLRLLHTYDEKGEKVTTRFSRHGDEVDDEAIQRLSGWHRKGLIPSNVWVTPQLPFIIPITLGFVTALIIGDFMLNIIAALAW
jgi:preflagellin peptidase FlaK